MVELVLAIEFVDCVDSFIDLGSSLVILYDLCS